MIIVRYSEIGLKGQNRNFFEDILVRNIRECIKKQKKEARVIKVRGRIFVDTKEKINLRTVFGIKSYSYAVKVKADIEEIKSNISFPKSSFRVSCKRMDKSFPLTSMDVEKQVGAFIISNNPNLKVDLKNFQEEIGIEICEGNAYLYNQKIKCFGGLPLGSEGQALLIIENQNSIVAGLLMMKRGCHVNICMNKDIDISLLKEFSYGKSIKKIEDDNVIVKGSNKIEELEIQDKLILTPLIAYTQEEIDELEDEMRKACSKTD